MTNRPTVLLLRSRDGHEPYERALEGAGFAPVTVPVVLFRYINEDALLEALERPDAYSGLIVTSPRTTTAWSRLSAARELLAMWREKPTYCVGPTTASEARELGLDPSGEEQGSAKALAAWVARHHRAEEPLLFCCGEPRREELPSVLSDEGIRVKELVVYRNDVIEEAPLEHPPEWVLFFSPRAMEAARQWDWPWDAVRKGAIGATAGDVIGDYGWTADATAPYHEVDELVTHMAQLQFDTRGGS